MKIIHLIDYFQPKLGYQETFLAKEHGLLGHEVTVVTSNLFYRFPNYRDTFQPILGKRKTKVGKMIEKGITTVRLPSIEIPNTPLIILLNLYDTLAKIKPKVIFCHGLHSITSYMTAYYKPRLGYQLIYDSHAAFFNTQLRNTFPKRIWRTIFQKIAVPRIKKEADAIFAIGDEEKKLLCLDFHLNLDKIPIIRLGIDTKLFQYSNTKRMNIRQKLKIKNEQIVIVFAGKISPNKDVHVLVEAVNRMKSNKIRLILVGGGEREYITSLKKLDINGRMIIIPFVENKKLSLYYSASDIGVWPGNFTITLLEAMASRLPLILPRWWGTKYLDKSSAILRFTRGDINDLSMKIENLSHNRKLRITLGEKGRKFVAHNFSWEKIAEQVIAMVKS